MKPNELRELDAWMAEHVMGWRMVNHLRDFCSGSFICNRGADCLVWDWSHRGCNAWTPTTDPAAAFAVLEKCAARLGDFEHISINCCEGEFAIKMAHANWDWINAPTLPLAICLFAKQLYSQGENSAEK